MRRCVHAERFQRAIAESTKPMGRVRRKYYGHAGLERQDLGFAFDPSFAVSVEYREDLHVRVGMGLRAIARGRGLNPDAHGRRSLLISDQRLIGGASGKRLMRNALMTDERHRTAPREEEYDGIMRSAREARQSLGRCLASHERGLSSRLPRFVMSRIVGGAQSHAPRIML